MLKNILTVAYRNLIRHLGYSLINIAGLAIAISCSLIIFLYVYGEWSYDKSFANGDRIYRIGVSFFNIGKFANGPERLLEVLPDQYAGIETATRITKDRDVIIHANGQEFREPFAYYTDSAFFKVFDFQFVQGDRETVLRAPGEIVVNESIAEKFFGTQDVLGQTIELGKDRVPYKISGVVRDFTFNTHVNSPIWISNHSVLTGEKVWSSAACYSYVLLKEGQAEADLLQAVDRMIATTVFEEFGRSMGIATLEDYRANDNAVKFYVHPLEEIYFKSKLNLELTPGGDESSVYVFGAIAFFILVLAAVNFVNLTTARAAHRAREVGIRKAMGTSRRRLIGQFLGESVLTSTIAMLFSLVLAELFLVAFESITGTALMGTIWKNPATVMMFFGFSVFVGLLSGVYPAFYLTSFKPVAVLKGNFAAAGGGTFRNILVVFQFTVSIVLIISSVVVQQQMHFMRTRDLGFNQENVLTIDNCDVLGDQAMAFKDELDKQAGVVGSSYHMGEPGSKRILSFYTYQTAAMDNRMTINTYFGDHDFIDVMGLRLIKGRTFDRNRASDSLAVVLNEAAVTALDLGDNPVGAVVNTNQTIIGVVSDFHWESLRSKIAPLAIILGKSDQNAQLGFKLQPGTVGAFLKQAESKWKQLKPDEDFRYHFLDGNFGELLRKEASFSSSINIFTGLAILISCLGLFGLSAFTAEQRTREIGIRKVLGATATSIVVMLNRKFTVLVLLAVAISVPVSLFIAGRWLENFAYRIDIGAGMFVVSILVAMVLAWLTVSYHSIRASSVNPAETLKYE